MEHWEEGTRVSGKKAVSLLISVIPFFVAMSCAGVGGEKEEQSHLTPEKQQELSDDFCNKLFASSPPYMSENDLSDERIHAKNSDGDDNEYGENSYENEFGEENEGIGGLHYQGKDCSSCHSAGNEYIFNIGGTIFRKKDAGDESVADAAEGYTVELITRSCKSIVARKGSGSGNFFMRYELSEDFIPFVLDPNGKRVNRASAVHAPDRTACNSCHTQTGKNGAPGRIVSYDYYGMVTSGGGSGGSSSTDVGGGTSGGGGKEESTSAPTFKNDIHPILTQKCMSCHVEGGQAGNTRYILRDDPQTDYNTITQNELVVVGKPDESLILLKPSGKRSHGGGIVLPEGGAEYNKIREWIEAGAKYE